MDDMVRVFRALGDPARQKILGLLEGAGELCVTDVAGEFAMAQPSVSHHLRILKEAGLVAAEKRGKEVFYRINAVALRKCCGLFFSKFECCRPLLRPAAAKAEG